MPLAYLHDLLQCLLVNIYDRDGLLDLSQQNVQVLVVRLPHPSSLSAPRAGKQGTHNARGAQKQASGRRSMQHG